MATRVGSGDYVYEVDVDWAKLPDGWHLKETPDVAVDAEDRVFVFCRGEHPVLIFDRDGSFLGSWGEDLFTNPHGMTMGPDGMLYCVDNGDHTVRKCTPDGEVLMTLGTPGQAAPYQSGVPFDRPTKVAVEEGTGVIYVADGYGNAKVHKFSPEGELLLSWGDYGAGPGEFNLVHVVALDGRGNAYIADRENHRVQVFDIEGRFKTEWHVHRPCGLFIGGEDEPLIYVGQLCAGWRGNQGYPNLGSRVSIHDLAGKELAWLGDIRRGTERPSQFLAPHGVSVDSHGDIYVGEVSFAEFGRNMDPPQELRSFRKLIKVS